MEIIEWKFYIHLLNLTTNCCEKCNYRSVAGIEPAGLRLRSSALQHATELHADASCQVLTTSSCIYARVLPC